MKWTKKKGGGGSANIQKHWPESQTTANKRFLQTQDPIQPLTARNFSNCYTITLNPLTGNRSGRWQDTRLNLKELLDPVVAKGAIRVISCDGEIFGCTPSVGKKLEYIHRTCLLCSSVGYPDPKDKKNKILIIPKKIHKRQLKEVKISQSNLKLTRDD